MTCILVYRTSNRIFDFESQTENMQNSVNPNELVQQIFAGRYDGEGELFDGDLCYFLECYPSEIQFGDPVFFGVVIQNTGKETARFKYRLSVNSLLSENWDRKNAQEVHPSEPLYLVPDSMVCERIEPEGNVKTGDGDEDWPFSPPTSCLNYFEAPLMYEEDVRRYTHDNIDFVTMGPRSDGKLQPGKKIVRYVESACFPALHDWKYSAFWNQVRKDLAQKDVFIRVRVTFPDLKPLTEKKLISGSFVLKIKGRSPWEMARIDRWYNTTPRECFPKKQASGYFRSEPGDAIRKRWPAPIFIRGIPFLPFSFMCQRIPFGTEMPKTLEDWKSLEDSWSAGTMRDEIKMTRLMVEFCQNCPTLGDIRFLEYEQHPEAFQDVLTWWKSLPDIQREYYRFHDRLATSAEWMEQYSQDSPESAQILTAARYFYRIPSECFEK